MDGERQKVRWVGEAEGEMDGERLRERYRKIWVRERLREVGGDG